MKPARIATLAAFGVALVAVVAWVTGGIDVGNPRFAPDFEFDIELPEPQAEDEGELEFSEEDSSEGSELLSVGLIVIGIAILSAVLWRVIKILGRVIEWVRNEAPRLVADESVDARVREALRDASEQAAREIEDVPSGKAADAVIACWVALERAAEQAGTPRATHTTPTEFTVDLLHRHDADPRAVATLLGLYHAARFSTSQLPQTASRTAAGALRQIAASLSGNAAGMARREDVS
jgi:cytoskeletal protein RodZ